MSNYWCWCDMEMTGLGSTDVILEVCCVITSADSNLDIIDKSKNYVIYQDNDVLSNMNQWCQKQHTLSGLTKKVSESDYNIQQVESELLDWISPYAKNNAMPLCGNSIGTDRAFMLKEMPNLHAKLHYRNIDVTSIKILLDKLSNIEPFVKKQTHRALDDIMESIEELRYYISLGCFLTKD